MNQAVESVISNASSNDKLLACLHCGLCLEACPTYVLTGDENDSPRGRVYLMRAVEEGRLDATSRAFERHIGRCLGCRACETVCPAGVEYGELLETARETLLTKTERRGLRGRLLRFVLNSVWLKPRRLRFAFRLSRLFRDSGIAGLALRLRLARVFSRRTEFALAMLVGSAPARRRQSRQLQHDAMHGKHRPRVEQFTGCVMEGLFLHVNAATRRVLDRSGFDVGTPEKQVCCGALHAHAGDLENARGLARLNIDAFEGDDPIITNAGGCGAMLVSYEHLLARDGSYRERACAFSSRVKDVSQIISTGDLEPRSITSGATVTYDASCHLIHGQRVGEAPLEMMKAGISNLRFEDLEGSDRCCGGAGIYNLLEPELSTLVLEEKLANIRATGATILATGNPGCQMQIAAGARLAGMEIRVCHPVELIDEAIGAPRDQSSIADGQVEDG